MTIDDLRRELADVIRHYEGDTTLHGSSADEAADEVLAAVALWLRQRAQIAEQHVTVADDILSFGYSPAVDAGKLALQAAAEALQKAADGISERGQQ